MASVILTIQVIGNEPTICNRPFVRGETISAVEYANGDPAGWHTQECIDYWVATGMALCARKE